MSNNVIPFVPPRFDRAVEIDMDAVARAERNLGVAHLRKFQAALNMVILAETDGTDEVFILAAWSDLDRAETHLKRARGILE